MATRYELVESSLDDDSSDEGLLSPPSLPTSLSGWFRLESDAITDEPTGGYDCQFVGEVPDSLLCLICTATARDPQQVDCCGKLFCQSCLSKLRQSRNNNCPNCRSTSWKSFSDKKSDRDLKSLTVKCSNLDISGCSWVGELRELHSHVSKCSNNLQPCKYTSIGCTIKLLKKDLPSHEKECTAEHLKLAVEKIKLLTERLQPLLVLPDRLKALEAMRDPATVPPFTIKITHFLERLEPTWESAPFYSHPNGYKLYMYLKIQLDFELERVHVVSMDVCLMRGEHDDDLVWPFRGVIRFEVLNQVEDCNHKQGCARFMERRMSEKNRRVPEMLEKSEVGWGMTHFLFPDSDEDEPYFLNGSLYIRVKDIELSELNTPWLLD